MAEHIIRRVAEKGLGYSVVDLNSVRHVLVAAVPRRGHTFRHQAEDTLGAIEAAVRTIAGCGAIVHQAVFLADMDHLAECRQVMHDFYGRDLPATSYVPQPPCDGKSLAIECVGVSQLEGKVQIDRVGEQLVVVRHDRLTWAHCAQVIPPSQTHRAYDDSFSGLERIQKLLDDVHMNFGQVIRTWFYCGAIGGYDGALSRYQELNRARRDFYRNIAFVDDHRAENRHGWIYPASTGIGINGRDIVISAIALATDRQDIVEVPLENPKQTPACRYSPNQGSVSPIFARGMALSCDDHATIFISGTASITGEETRHPGDVVAQVHETLDNIAAVLSEENLSRHGLPGLGMSLKCLGMARVYVRRPEDFAKVHAVCKERLGELPLIYAVADICRPELLVEIEGIAFARHAASLHSSCRDPASLDREIRKA